MHWGVGLFAGIAGATISAQLGSNLFITAALALGIFLGFMLIDQWSPRETRCSQCTDPNWNKKEACPACKHARRSKKTHEAAEKPE